MIDPRPRFVFWVVLIGMIFFVVEATGTAISIALNLPWPKSNPKSFHIPDWTTGYKPRPMQTHSLNGVTIHINQLGFRGKVPQREIINPMLLIGDSIVMGKNVAEDQTFASRIGGINAGIEGYSTWQELDRVRSDLSSFRFQQVVLVISPNDVMQREISHWQARRFLTEGLFNVSNYLPFYEGWTRLYLYKKGIIRPEQEDPPLRTEDVIDMDKWYHGLVSEPIPDKIWEEWLNSLIEMRDQFHDANFFILLAPPRSQVKAYRAGQHNFVFNERMRAFAKEHGFNLLDPLPYLSAQKDNTLFHDTVHFNPSGHFPLCQRT